MQNRFAQGVGGGLLAVLLYYFMSAMGAPAAILSYLLIAFVACSALAYLGRLITSRFKNRKQYFSRPYKTRTVGLHSDSFAAHLIREMWRALDAVRRADTSGVRSRAQGAVLQTKWFKPRPKKQVVARVEDREEFSSLGTDLDLAR
jgi:TM2 domain-containing membrane protein YozV